MLIVAMAMIFLMSSDVFASDEWITKNSSMPTPRYDLTCFAIDGKIYAINGKRQVKIIQGETGVKIIEEYDPQTDNWLSKSPLPHSDCSCIETINNKIYLLSKNQVWEYIPQTDTWNKKTFLPKLEILAEPGCIVLGEKIYVIIKEKKENRKYEYKIGEYNTVLDVWAIKNCLSQDFETGSKLVEANNKIYLLGKKMSEYDPQEDKWSMKTSFPADYYADIPATVVNNKIYVMRPTWKGILSIGPEVTLVYEYNPETDSWGTKTSMTTPRANFGMIVLGDKIYTIGGYCINISPAADYIKAYRNVEVYDTKADGWTKMSNLSEFKGKVGCIAMNSKVYVIGGIGIKGTEDKETTEKKLVILKGSALSFVLPKVTIFNTVEEYMP